MSQINMLTPILNEIHSIIITSKDGQDRIEAAGPKGTDGQKLLRTHALYRQVNLKFKILGHRKER